MPYVGQKIRYKSGVWLIPEEYKRAYFGFSSALFGVTGTIIATDDGRFGIQFDLEKPLSILHSCENKGPFGYCYWVDENLFDIIPQKIYDYEEMI